MTSLPPTRPTLLVRMKDTTDHDAWVRFVDLYAPLIYGFLRKRGLQDADAADLTQDVLRQVSTSINRLEYDANRGSFRSWLLTLVHHRLITHWRRDAHQTHPIADTAAYQRLNDLPQAVSNDSTAEWNVDYERQLFHYAAKIVKQDFTPATWQAFWKTAVDGLPAKEVASELDLTLAAVYLAKGRVMKRIKSEVSRLIGETDD